MQIDLSGKKALVCGSSQGIGKAIAVSFAKAGAKVVLVARNEEKLESVKSELSGSSHLIHPTDFSNEKSVNELVEFVKNEGIEILVNNTGGPDPGKVLEANWQDFESGLLIHLRTSQLLTQAVISNMSKKRFGRIINIISTSVKIPIPGLGVSNTIRGAMASWSKTLSNELASQGITVNNILPGFISTERLDKLIASRSKESGKSENVIEEQMISTVPAGRFGDPSEIASLASFLASEHANYITGCSIPVDGGKTGSL